MPTSLTLKNIPDAVYERLNAQPALLPVPGALPSARHRPERRNAARTSSQRQHPAATGAAALLNPAAGACIAPAAGATQGFITSNSPTSAAPGPAS